MPREWQFQSHDMGHVDSLSQKLNCSSLLAQVLLSRGFHEPTEAKDFLSAKLTSLQPPEMLPGAIPAAERIAAAIKDGRRITIYGDYDVDGMTSTAILHQCIQLAGGTVDYYIPCRLEEGYGLNKEAIRELHSADPNRLLVTVDCGITSCAEADLANELGLELIITDHHTLTEKLPNAAELVHPRLPDANEESFPHLCGAGVAFKLAWAISQQVSESSTASERMRQFLKRAVGLAMIGTVADVVPLVGENRMLVKYGLGNLREQAGPGLSALMKVNGITEKSTISAEDVGFGIGPRLNAAGRLGQARLGVELLITEQEDRAQQLAVYLDGLNKQRQSVERKILKQAREEIQNHPEWNDDPVLVIAHHDWHSGVIGIVASRIAEQFEKPTILIASNHGTEPGQGSGRTFGGVSLHAAVCQCESLLETFGGHAAAIGLRISNDKVDEFRQKLCQVEQVQTVTEEDHPRQIDAEVTLPELTVKAIQEIEYLGPFGCENERPVFVATGLNLPEPPRPMGEDGRHFSAKFRHYGSTLRAISFGRGEWVDEMNEVTGSVSVCFKPIINEFRGRKSVELQVIDWRPDNAPQKTETQGSVAIS